MYQIMNKRIKELAKQSRQIGEYGNYGQIQLSPQQFEQKFAELIVQECIANCDDLNSMKYIANHFGIKIERLNNE